MENKDNKKPEKKKNGFLYGLSVVAMVALSFMTTGKYLSN